ncbi:hypothetical protein I6A84_23740 [Frankia sp. CNm7]|uniref:Uncharacterized protein n=1 Tax=Frankia nepalensis TaxID=1836974 RepID=A0A937RAG0_9ACTN|nr:hypothetical protein [Frankia nepalensis]MBL7499629.1 hypothetical protein [Frankia nepalensis]MBL7510287.1 hypothetical protein [Frankia nepalensis]MBL7521018.1 hypothetical protein [Frankia nepalensis]MBL7626855.1 hypothetical protein [Frankia nepalensis]
MTDDSRLSCWLRVREFAVPPPMIETATARRSVGDWAGACAAARVDADLSPRSAARAHGRQVAAQLKDDLRRLAPDLLRWHLPRVGPDGLLRPGLTVCLARYPADDSRPLCLVARTPPAWAGASQRVSLALWDGSPTSAGRHPHPHPDRRFRLDLHRHLWDASRAGELRDRAGSPSPPAGPSDAPGGRPSGLPPGCAVDRWPAEADILLRADGVGGDAVAVRLGERRRLVLRPRGSVPEITRPGRGIRALPVLPHAATWVPPDVLLLRAGLIEADRLHPLVAAALDPRRPRPGPARAEPAAGDGATRFVECRGARHRIGLVDGALAPLDHDPDEIRRETLLASLTGTPLPCLRAIDEAHRRPRNLDDIRGRLDHGDVAGALAAVEALLGPDALLRDGTLRDELETAAHDRLVYGLFRSGLADHAAPLDPSRHRRDRNRPRLAMHH